MVYNVQKLSLGGNSPSPTVDLLQRAIHIFFQYVNIIKLVILRTIHIANVSPGFLIT